MAGSGKIDRLPFELREQVNRRLRDGETGRKICAWLNALPEVRPVLAEHFDGEDITEQNLSNWRQGGYAKWLSRQDTVNETRELAHLSVQIAQASGGNISDGAAQILAGEILTVMEDLKAARRELVLSGDTETDKERVVALAESFDAFAGAVTKLRKADQNAEALRQRDKQLTQADEQLALEQRKFMRTTCELFLKWREDRRATDIADGPGPTEDKIAALGQAMFGDLWEAR